MNAPRSPRLLALITVLGFGYGLLYLPIAVLSVYSFNASARVAVWGGFSLRWYQALAENPQIIDAALLSLRIAAISATVATGLGALAALALRRGRRLSGRTGLRAMLLAPLVMPDIIIGISLLLLFPWLNQSFGWPLRGATTITIAHITFSVAYVSVVVTARLAGIDPALNDAATDLGAPPAAVFFAITLALMAPGLAAGWLLAFTLSLDDLVIASFVSGPGASTLPMVVFSMVRLGISPEINALSTLLIILVGVLLGAAMLLLKKKLPVNRGSPVSSRRR
ncbi:MAG: ABC transporter permease subunit [Hyphomicrobiales bacterium]